MEHHHPFRRWSTNNYGLHHSPRRSSVAVASLLSQTVSAPPENTALLKKQCTSPVQVNQMQQLGQSHLKRAEVEGSFLFILSEPDNIRLADGTSRCRGILEMRRAVEWKPVGKMPVGFRFAGRVCGALDCGSVMSVGQQRRNSYETKWFIKPDCNESSPADCSILLKNLPNNVKIDCSGKLLHAF